MLSVRIVIPCFTEQRWDEILRAVRSARAQTYSAEVVVVVDHNPWLADKLNSEIGRDVTILPNRFAQGVSGARNSGAMTAKTDLLAFLDDDTVAAPTWLANLVAAYCETPSAVGIGGAIVPLWEGRVPGWLPEEFLWVVGATPPGRRMCRVRNVWGSNMLVNRASFVEVGGFCTSFGKVGYVSEPEDTELCIRMSAQAGQQLGWVYTPHAVIEHAVPVDRTRWSSFVRRCWSEGAGKAALVARPHHDVTSLGEESDFVRQVLTTSLAHYVAAGVRGSGAGFGRAAAIVLGTGCAGMGYAVSKTRRARRAAKVATTPPPPTMDQPDQAVSDLRPQVRHQVQQPRDTTDRTVLRPRVEPTSPFGDA